MDIRLSLQQFFFLGSAALIPLQLSAQEVSKMPSIHIIYMGGNDCPPCVNWRRFELPKLESSDDFKGVKFTHVLKTIKSPVPPNFFLPADARPYKEKLDLASAGHGGSPQTAVMVDGEVYDYFYGTRTAEAYLIMLSAIKNNTKYPFDRCIRRGSELYSCEKKFEVR